MFYKKQLYFWPGKLRLDRRVHIWCKINDQSSYALSFPIVLWGDFWQMPISAFCHREDYDVLSENEQGRLSLLQTWDCQDNDIAVTTFGFLQNRRVDVFCRDRVWRSGKYVFTIDDYEGDLNELNIGYANDQDSKCYHFLEMDDGNYAIPPNNLLRWHNPDFIIPYDKESPPRVKIYDEEMTSEDIDRSYGNSPYSQNNV